MLAQRYPCSLTVAALFPALVTACGSDVPYQDVALESADEMFSDTALPRFDLSITPPAIASLLGDPDTYVPGTFSHGNTVISGVGVRLKGSASFDDFDGKPAFKVQFDEFIDGRGFLGLENLTLNNMKQDPTKLREWLAYRVFRAAGVSAPRTGYARVFVNDEDYGLYLNVETIDDVFLAGNFDDPSGGLYEGDYGDDLHPSHVWNFEQDEGDDEQRTDLASLANWAHMDGDTPFYHPETVIDTESFLAYTAVEAVIGHWDGYWIAHNYRVYHEPTLDKWYFIPWGTDQAFWQPTQPFDQISYLNRRCVELETCLVDYVSHALDTVSLMQDLDLDAEIDRVRALIDHSAFDDPRSFHSSESIDRNRDNLRTYLRERPERMSSWLDCVEDGREMDVDGDGFGRCYADCDDDREDIYPTRTEICDGVDNNCSGNIDDSLECPCESADIDGVAFYFCTLDFHWTEAKEWCEAKGFVLARIDDQAQNNAVWGVATAIRDTTWYIGLSDHENAGTFAWADGSPLEYENWQDNQPSLDGVNSCAYYYRDRSSWDDIACGNRKHFICREPDAGS